MSDQGYFDNPFGPPEPDQVTPEEYSRAYNSLREVADFDLSAINTIDDLSADFSLVGDDIQTLILGGGKIQTTKFDLPAGDSGTKTGIDRTWVIRGEVGDHEIFATSSGRFVYVGAYVIRGNQQLGIFNFYMPTNSDLNSSGVNPGSLYAHDWRGKSVRSLYPAKDKRSPNIQREFANIVQEGIKDLLQVIESP